MRLRSLALRGVTRFVSGDPVSIDFDQFGPGLIALVGPNGAGKTTILESPIAALYREFPSRPGWYEHMHGRDSFLEVLFEEAGSEIRIRTQVDAERRTTEQYVFVDGASVTTGRATEAAGEVERRFGSLNLLLASVVSAQNRAGNFLLMSKGDRKALFAELLNLGAIEVLHEKARERRASAQVAVERARSELTRIEELLAAKPAAEVDVQEAHDAQEAAAGRLETARQEETAATATLERARASAERLRALRAARDGASQALADADQALKDAIAAGPRARQEAARRRESNEAQLADVAAQERRANERHAAAVKGIDARRMRLEAALEQREALEAARAQCQALEAELETLEAAERALAEAERERDLADAAAGAADQRVEDAQGRLDAERERLAEEAKLLDRVPCTAAPGWQGGAYERVDLAGTCPLLKAAQAAKARGPELTVDAALIGNMQAAHGRWEAAKDAVTAATVACDTVRLAEIRRALPGLREQAGRLATLAQAAQDLKGLATELARVNEEKSKELKDAAARRERLDSEVSQIEEDLKKAVGEALTRESTARGRAEDARERSLSAAREFLAASDDVTMPAADAALSRARQTRIEAERALRDADRAHATTTAALDALRKHEETLPGAQDLVRAADVQLRALALLDQALGRDGIQALEIDAAGPEVARLCNDLLEACYGPRFSISFETLREKKSARGEYAESFEVKVRDRGQERPVEALSGGERVIVGESIGLAISILNARKNSIRHETLFRDETAGALDPENASRYVDMLRRSLALGGFHQVIFVAHQKEVVERADVRLIVANGRVTVEGAPGLVEGFVSRDLGEFRAAEEASRHV